MLKKPPYSGTTILLDGIFAGPVGGALTRYSDARTSIENGSWSSVKTLNFRLIKPRNRPNNPFSASYYKETRQIAEMSNGSYVWKGYLEDFFTGYAYSLPVLSTIDAETIARAKLLSRLKDSSVNLAQAYAERKQTVNLIAKSVNRIASAALAIRRGNLRHASNLFGLKYGPNSLKKEITPSSKNLSNYWLEFSYGWRPLINDIYGSAELLAKTFYQNRPTLIRAGHSIVKQYSDHPMFDLLPTHSKREIFKGGSTEKASYVVAFAEDNAFAQRMSSTGITNPLLLAWELIPYSFVVDWFVPVGTYLGNLTATDGLAFRSGVFTKSAELNGKTSWISTGQSAEGHSLQSPGRLFSIHTKTRSVLVDFPSPKLNISPPLGVSQTLSGLALLIQAFKR